MPAKAKLTTRERTTSNVSADNLNKGSELSFAEADSNFFNLRDQTFAISDGSTSTDIEAGETITFSGASVSGNTVTISASGGNLSNLQVNDTTISPVNTNDDLTLTANGSGVVKVDTLEIDDADGVIGGVTHDSITLSHVTGGNNQAMQLHAGDGNNSQMRFFAKGGGAFFFFNDTTGQHPFIGTGGGPVNSDLTIGTKDDPATIHFERLGGGQRNINLTPDTGSNKGHVRIVDNVLILTSTQTPSGVGQVNDVQGMFAYDATNFYICTGAYDGSTAIWKKIPLQSI